MNRKYLAVLLALFLLAVSLTAAGAKSAGYTVISRNNGQMEITRVIRDPEIPMGKDGWTILLYLCGTDLETEGGCASGDLEELLNAEWGSGVRVVVQTGGTKKWQNDSVHSKKIERFLIEDGECELIETLPDASMGDADTLTDFIRWGTKNYGAARMGLVLWNHGGGSISGVCFDETKNYRSLSLASLDMALGNAYESMTDRFEFIGFDACLMATLETANILVPYARFMYASQEVEPGTGWDYTTLISWLSKHPNADGAELGKVQVRSYLDYCTETYGNDESVTFSVIDLDKLDPLILSLDTTAADLYNNAPLAELSRSIRAADNFGGNSRSEGYTNMVDLAEMLRAAAAWSSNAQTALDALEDAVLKMGNGAQHANAGGLSIYFPLCVGGSSELSVFRDICTSTYYLALADKIAYGTTGQDVSAYDNSELLEDTDSIWDVQYDPDSSIGTYSGSNGTADSDCPLPIVASYLDDEGTYTVELENVDELAYGSCVLFWNLEMDGEDYYLYLGEDDDVIVDFDECTITDNFDGSWVYMGEDLLPIELVSQYDDVSLYSAEVLLNGEESYLRIAYDWDSGEFRLLGTWGGVNENGMAEREGPPLSDGDQVEIIYYFVTEDGDMDYITSDPIIISGEAELYYDDLAPGEYYYSIYLYDIYGGVWDTGEAIFGVDEDGSLYFIESDDMMQPEGLEVSECGLDDSGNYTVVVEDVSALEYATCKLYYEIDTDLYLYLGEDDNVNQDDDTITDNFDATWLAIDEYILPFEMAAQEDGYSYYSADILLNDSATTLWFAYSWSEGEYVILGTADDDDEEFRELRKGDTLTILFQQIDSDGNAEYVTGETLTLGRNTVIEPTQLPEGTYLYGINLYSTQGETWEGDLAEYQVLSDGSIRF